MEEIEDSCADSHSQPWVEFLDNIAENYGPSNPQKDVLDILRQTLFSSEEPSPIAAAQQIDTYYQETYLLCDPLMRFQEDKGMGGFLHCLYESVFDLVLRIPYNHTSQDILVEFIAELRRLPPKQLKIWNEDVQIYTRDPIFASVMDDNWNGYFPSEDTSSSDIEKECIEWVNFSAFIARCTQSGLNDNFSHPCKYPSFDIPKGLEEEWLPGFRRSSLIRVAAQYILLAGSKLCEHWLEASNTAKDRAVDRWKLWAKKLQEFSESKDLEMDLRTETLQAHDRIVALKPDLFRDSKDESKIGEAQ
ncbi:hypothetical protein F5Y04DRAFT_247527 [Hypomontagnella monticulosa]|nr:hypothetical protein F5Y04DRAFT_247527 [Hypomontagnella monticulosa]